MKFALLSIASLLLAATWSSAGNTKPSTLSGHISNSERMEIIRTFTADLCYVRTAFPMGQKGLALKEGKISPSAEQLQEQLTLWGPAVKPGDQVMITNVSFDKNRIRFEINGGPIKRKKWYQHVVLSGASGDIPLDKGDDTNNPHGTFLDLVFDHDIPQVTTDQVKDMLSQVIDFNSKSAEQAYLETIPPKAKDAILKHQVLVGMNREMVIHAKGRPPRKDREKAGEEEYEEWIYGEPPQDVDFVRFVGDYVVRVETMKVTGEKVVRTEKEIDLEGQQPSVAQGGESARPAGSPSLRRPGEAPDPEAQTERGPSQPTTPISSPQAPGAPPPGAPGAPP